MSDIIEKESQDRLKYYDALFDEYGIPKQINYTDMTLEAPPWILELEFFCGYEYLGYL